MTSNSLLPRFWRLNQVSPFVYSAALVMLNITEILFLQKFEPLFSSVYSVTVYKFQSLSNAEFGGFSVSRELLVW